jgi:hypothetical protein
MFVLLPTVEKFAALAEAPALEPASNGAAERIVAAKQLVSVGQIVPAKQLVSVGQIVPAELVPLLVVARAQS